MPRLTPFRIATLVALAVAGALSNGCGKGPTDPSDNVIETFTGTVAVGAGNKGEHRFESSNSGELFISLVSLTPPAPSSSPFSILALGTFDGASCVYDGTVQTTGAFITVPAQEGSFCVAIAAVSSSGFTTVETYEIRVSHP